MKQLIANSDQADNSPPLDAPRLQRFAEMTLILSNIRFPATISVVQFWIVSSALMAQSIVPSTLPNQDLSVPYQQQLSLVGCPCGPSQPNAFGFIFTSPCVLNISLSGLLNDDCGAFPCPARVGLCDVTVSAFCNTSEGEDCGPGTEIRQTLGLQAKDTLEFITEALPPAKPMERYEFDLAVTPGIRRTFWTFVTEPPIPIWLNSSFPFDDLEDDPQSTTWQEFSPTSGTFSALVSTDTDNQSMKLFAFPTQSGNFSFTVRVENDIFREDDPIALRTFTLEVKEAPEIVTENLTEILCIDNVLGVEEASPDPYEAAIAAQGGTKPYVWHLRSGDLPSGLTFEGGEVDVATIKSGLTLAGACLTKKQFPLVIEVVDAKGNSNSKNLFIYVARPGVSRVDKERYRLTAATYLMATAACGVGFLTPQGAICLAAPPMCGTLDRRLLRNCAGGSQFRTTGERSARSKLYGISSADLSESISNHTR